LIYTRYRERIPLESREREEIEMAQMLEQTKRAIEALKAAGLKRSEFSVRTPMNSRGEYEETIIMLRAPRERQVEVVPAIVEQGLGVMIVRINGKDLYPDVLTDSRYAGKLTRRDFDTPSSYCSFTDTVELVQGHSEPCLASTRTATFS
jgi:hypothetical protein